MAGIDTSRSSPPTVSVCIPAYNAAPFIAETIESVLAQTFVDFELIVVDDNSSDDTAAIVARYTDPRIRFLQNIQLLGLAGNWNRAVSTARGRFIKLLCHDDLIYPRCLQVQVGVLQNPANSDVDLTCVRRDIIDERGRIVLRSRGISGIAGKITGENALRAIVRSGTNPIGEPMAVLARGDAFRRAGEFDDSNPYMIDIEMWSRILTGGRLYGVTETLCAFRISPSSLSTRISSSQAKAARQFLRMLRTKHPCIVGKTDLLLGQSRAALYQPIRRLIYRVSQGKA